MATFVAELRERVTLQTATVTRDAYGAEVLTWHDGPTLWATVVERGGREPLLADRPVMVVSYVVSYEVTIRTGVTVSHHDRLLWRGKRLAIDTVTPQPAAGRIVLRCIETTP
jgi:SPP1 family predicted phage head-tail adaptor